MSKPQVTHVRLFDIQVCVPSDWTDEAVVEFAEQENPCGTANGWCIRRQGDKNLGGFDERVPCDSHEGFVHIMLDA